jgi:hypothetical protein
MFSQIIHIQELDILSNPIGSVTRKEYEVCKEFIGVQLGSATVIIFI